MSPSVNLASLMILTLVAMSSSRKVLGPAEVAKWLVGHRTDIGVAVGWTIALCFLVAGGLLPASLAPEGAWHLTAVCVPQQLLFLRSLVARGDLPPRHPHRLALLALGWVGLLAGGSGGGGQAAVALEVASLWVVKLRLRGGDPPPLRGTGPSEARHTWPSTAGRGSSSHLLTCLSGKHHHDGSQAAGQAAWAMCIAPYPDLVWELRRISQQVPQVR
jgi:hypothetical protein